jgi:hypothetical protein
LVGPLHALEAVVEQWEPLVGAVNLRLTTPPRILTLPPPAQKYAARGLRVAVIRHETNLGPTLVRRLRTQLRFFRISDVIVEEGYFLSPTASRVGPDVTEPWSVTWETRHLEVLCRHFRIALPPDILGAAFVDRWKFPRKVVLIDTGDKGAATQTGFEIEFTAEEQPSDHHGHGTSIGNLIRMSAPQAEVHSYRVMRRGNHIVESSVLLNAITSATMTIGKYQVVIIPQRASLSRLVHGQRDAIHAVVQQNATHGYPTPVVVCAAGNAGPREVMDYPATVPGVVVAVALDWVGQIANYNCRSPAGTSVYTVGATGGVEKDPLGKIVRQDKPAKVLYGSSYAAALVVSSLVG